jgi:branched-chain amino acid transport system substrate-binding protein
LGWLALAGLKPYGAPQTVKIGLVAPFEGLYRASGYEVLFAVKLALQERNQGEGVQGYRVELVALNDFNNPAEAARQAQALVADPDIVGVVGHLSSATTEAALPVYQAAELAVAVPWSVEAALLAGQFPGTVSVAATSEETASHLEALSQEMGFEHLESLTTPDLPAISDEAQAIRLETDAVTASDIILALRRAGVSLPLFGGVEAGNVQLLQVAGAAANELIFVSPGPDAAQLPVDSAFVEAYQALSGLPPGPRAVLAYEATNVLLDSIEQTIITRGGLYDQPPNRRTVREQLALIRRSGLTGPVEFNSEGQRLNAPVWIYQISEARYPGTLIGP